MIGVDGKGYAESGSLQSILQEVHVQIYHDRNVTVAASRRKMTGIVSRH